MGTKSPTLTLRMFLCSRQHRWCPLSTMARRMNSTTQRTADGVPLYASTMLLGPNRLLNAIAEEQCPPTEVCNGTQVVADEHDSSFPSSRKRSNVAEALFLEALMADGKGLIEQQDVEWYLDRDEYASRSSIPDE